MFEQVDALMSLAMAGTAASAQGPVCRPKLLDPATCGHANVRASSLYL